jgi:hypothetical protein
MVTETNRESSAAEATAAGGRTFGQLWQVPTLLAGLLTVVGICATLPLHHRSGAHQLDGDLAAIRKALEGPSANLENVRALAEKTLAGTGQHPELAGEAHFLLGSVYQRLGDRSPAGQGADSWKKALPHLEQAEKLGVRPGDRAALTVRLARAWLQNGRDVNQVIAYLSRAVSPTDDEAAEGYRLLAQAYLALPVPNLEGALDANLRLLALPIDNEEILGPARLLAADILLRQRKPAEALRMLENIGSRAPSAVLARARFLQGVCCQDLGLWDRAIPLWKTVLLDPTPAPGGRGQILYYLGRCYRHVEPPDEAAAARAWEEAMKLGAESGQAAALSLAELRLFGANPASALEAYRRALDRVASPKDYRNTLIPLEKARHRIEFGCQFFNRGHDFDSALQLAVLYKKVALAGVAQSLDGQAAEAWARDLQTQSSDTGSDPTRRGEQIRALFVRAGSAYQEAAATRPAAEQPKMLWQSASCSLQGEDFPRAVAVLEQFVQFSVPDDWRGEGFFTLAEARLTLSQKEPGKAADWKRSAREAYLKAIEYPGPFASRARYQLALAELEQPATDPADERHHLDQAEALLQQNLEPKVVLLAPDAHEKSLFRLASLLVRRHNYDQAYLRLQEAVDRYPANPTILQARGQLAECYHQLAYQEINYLNSTVKPDAQLYHQRKKGLYLDKAVGSYEKLADDLKRLEKTGKLTAAGQAILTRGLFAIADCRFEKGEYEEALRQSKELAERYAGRVECLTAFQNIWRCAGAKGLMEEARKALDQARATLDSLPEEAFRGSPTTKQEWQNWIKSRADFLRPASNNRHR